MEPTLATPLNPGDKRSGCRQGLLFGLRLVEHGPALHRAEVSAPIERP